jgi:hypothetical protein
MFELNNGRELILDIVTKIIFTEKTPPKAFVAQLLFHTNQDLTLSNKPKTLFEVVNHSLVIYICREKKIKMTGCKMVENMPFKNATIYQHEYNKAKSFTATSLETVQLLAVNNLPAI